MVLVATPLKGVGGSSCPAAAPPRTPPTPFKRLGRNPLTLLRIRRNRNRESPAGIGSGRRAWGEPMVTVPFSGRLSLFAHTGQKATPPKLYTITHRLTGNHAA